MDNEKLYEKIMDKKMESYKDASNTDNFLAPGELRVTITLSEYRKLVSNDATRQAAIDASNKDKWAREEEIKKLKEENARLKGENYDLKTEVDSLKEQLEKLSGKDVPDA